MMDTTLSPLLASSAAPSGFLSVESGSLAGQRFPLPQAPGALLLGRERLCNIRFDPERDRVVGRTHARIEVRGDGIYLVDLNSANGTFRSDGSAVRGELRLNPGERFQLGGEGGPWLSLQTAAQREAVHMAPAAADMPTLITPPAPAKPWPVPAAAPPAMREPIQSAPIQSAPIRTAPLHAPEPALPRTGAREVPPVPHREPEVVRRPEFVAADPVAQQQQTQYRRQVAAIALLLLLASSVGLALGLRNGPVEDDVELNRAE